MQMICASAIEMPGYSHTNDLSHLFLVNSVHCVKGDDAEYISFPSFSFPIGAEWPKHFMCLCYVSESSLSHFSTSRHTCDARKPTVGLLKTKFY